MAPTGESGRRLAPQVTADVLGGARAYLLGWARLPVGQGGGWGARLGWVEMTDEGAWIARSGLVPGDSVQRVEGEDYSRVPRDPRPRDDSDPRDPGYAARPHWDPRHDGIEPDF